MKINKKSKKIIYKMNQPLKAKNFLKTSLDKKKKMSNHLVQSCTMKMKTKVQV